MDLSLTVFNPFTSQPTRRDHRHRRPPPPPPLHIPQPLSVRPRRCPLLGTAPISNPTVTATPPPAPIPGNRKALILHRIVSKRQRMSMAPSNPCSSPEKKARTASSTAVDGALPLDALWEVLLRLSARRICRLRLVCRSWRSITYDPAFIMAHQARHTAPLLVGRLLDRSSEPREYIIFMDLSGRVVKRIHIGSVQLVLPTHLNMICVAIVRGCKANVLNLATGACQALPEDLAKGHSHGRDLSDYTASFTLWQVPTGKYKVLRILNCIKVADPAPRRTKAADPAQMVEILTLDTGRPMEWRAKQAPPFLVSTRAFDRVVVKGVVYFLIKDGHLDPTVQPDRIALFDLKTEEWISSYLKGPLSSESGLNDIIIDPGESSVLSVHLAELNDLLVVAALTEFSSAPFLDIWCLMDLEKCLWEKRYRIPFVMGPWDELHSLMLLHDGRMLICACEVTLSAFRGGYTKSVMRKYDPETNTLGPDKMNGVNVVSIGIYTGSLLGVRNGGFL